MCVLLFTDVALAFSKFHVDKFQIAKIDRWVTRLGRKIIAFQRVNCSRLWFSDYIFLLSFVEFRSTKRFGSDGKRFEHLAFLNLAQNVVCLVWSYISKLIHLHYDNVFINLAMYVPWTGENYG